MLSTPQIKLSTGVGIKGFNPAWGLARHCPITYFSEAPAKGYRCIQRGWVHTLNLALSH